MGCKEEVGDGEQRPVVRPLWIGSSGQHTSHVLYFPRHRRLLFSMEAAVTSILASLNTSASTGRRRGSILSARQIQASSVD
jgi:hypothetical protein